MNSPFGTAIWTHNTWIVRFKNSLQGRNRESFEPDQIRMDNLCEFGQWLYANPGDFPSVESYEHIKAIHARFHEQASVVATLIRQSAGYDNIESALTELQNISRLLVAALNDAKTQKQGQTPEQRMQLLRVVCNQIIERQQDREKLMAEICEALVSTGGYTATWIGFAEDDAEKTVKPHAYAGTAKEYLGKVKVSWDGTRDLGRGPTGTAIRTGNTQINRDIMSTMEVMMPWWEEWMKHGLLSCVVLPVSPVNHAKGALTIYASKFDAFTDEDVKTLSSIADALGRAL